jgi:hypothetical protein
MLKPTAETRKTKRDPKITKAIFINLRFETGNLASIEKARPRAMARIMPRKGIPFSG